MASLALVRALASEPGRVRPRRVNSSTLIDRMRTIPEGQLLAASPLPARKFSSSGIYFGTSGLHSKSYNTSLESSSERVTLLPHDEDEREDDPDCCDKHTCHNILTTLMAFMTVCSMVTQVVSIPLYYDAMSDSKAGSDAFIASFIVALWQPFIFFSIIFFFIYIQNPKKCSVFRPRAPWSNIAIAGVLGGLSTILVAFTSLPDRTSPGLQAILQQCSIPFTALTRFIILRKGINKKQLVCIFTLFIGIFITLEPTIFSLRQMGPWEWRNNAETNPHAWYYYVIYGFSQLPLALAYTLMEQGQKTREVETMAYTAWYQLFLLLSYILFIWTDFIPDFGMAQSSSSNFIEKLEKGFQCFFAEDKNCAKVPLLAAINTISTAGTTLFSILLIRYAEGALFTVIVMAFVTPLSALFWTFFSAAGTLHWKPIFDLSTVFLLGGVLIMMPSVVMYAYFRDDPEPTEPEPTMAEIEAQRNAARQKAIERRRSKNKKRKRHWTVTYDNRRSLAVGVAVAPARKLHVSKSAPNLQRLKSTPVVIGGF